MPHSLYSLVLPSKVGASFKGVDVTQIAKVLGNDHKFVKSRPLVYAKIQPLGYIRPAY